jgi:hypothetical protein
MHTVVCGSLLAGERETKSRAKQDVAIGVLDVKCELVEARGGDSKWMTGQWASGDKTLAKERRKEKRILHSRFSAEDSVSAEVHVLFGWFHPFSMLPRYS